MLHSGEFALDMLYKLVHCRGGRSGLEGTSLFPNFSPMTCQTESCTGVPGLPGQGAVPRPAEPPAPGGRQAQRGLWPGRPWAVLMWGPGCKGRQTHHSMIAPLLSSSFPSCYLLSMAPRAWNIILAIWSQLSWLCPLQFPVLTRPPHCWAEQGMEALALTA